MGIFKIHNAQIHNNLAKNSHGKKIHLENKLKILEQNGNLENNKT